MQTFTRSIGFVTRVSSSDVVHSIVGLLAGTAGSSSERFHDALESLALDNAACRAKFDRGISNAIEMQQCLVEQGVALVEKRSIRSTGPFRYALLAEGHSHKYFRHPMTLSKLALFLVDTYRESDVKNKHLPLILAAANDNDDMLTLVGVTGSAEAEERKKCVAVLFLFLQSAYMCCVSSCHLLTSVPYLLALYLQHFWQIF